MTGRRAIGTALAAALALLGSAAAPLAAQTVRTFTTARQSHGETRLAAAVDYAAGTLLVTPGSATRLYRLQLTYDPERFAPVSGYDAGADAVRLGVAAPRAAAVRVAAPDPTAQNAVIEFSPDVDLALDVTLGSVEGVVELGGLRLTNLRMRNGASTTALRFSRPNATRCGVAAIEAGGAELTVTGLGNSRCERIQVEGGVGKLTLDFSGEWRESAGASIRMAVGELVLRLPRTVGVRLTLDRFLAAFQPSGLTRDGSTYVSPGFDRADRRLDISLTSAVGGVRVEWID